MKKENKSAKRNRNFDDLVSKLSAEEILGNIAMSTVRGGDGDGNGSIPIIIPPPPTDD